MMMAMNRFRMVKVATTTNGTQKSRTQGTDSATGRAIPMDPRSGS
jgi:hypothetical protein